MALDPNIALGVRQIELPNQLAQYAQLSQIQNAQNQNRMAEMQLQEYERARGEEEGLRNYLAKGDLSTPEARKGLFQFGKTGREYVKSLTEQDAAALTAKNVQSQISERDFGLQKKKLDFAWSSVGSAATPQDAIQKINDGVKNGVFDMKAATADIQKLQNMTPEQYQQYRVQTVMGILDAKDKLGFMLPKTTRQDIGGSIVNIQDNPMMPGYGLPVAGASIAKTPTFGDIASQGQLNLARQKFAWEQANPGFELKETESGDVVGVNKRTLQAFPVMLGGAAPAAAPMAGAGMPGARMPAATTVPAIPGMTSVLDQQVPAAAPAAGTPLRGKGTAPTEGERKAATLLQRLRGSQNQLSQALLDDATAAGPQAFATAVGKLSTTGANLLNTEARQRVEAAQLDILDAALTLGTGAAYTREQLEGYRQSYFPTYGDKPGNIKDKQARLKNVIEAANIAAGKAQKLVPLPPPLERLPSGGGDVDTSNPLLNQ